MTFEENIATAKDTIRAYREQAIKFEWPLTEHLQDRADVALDDALAQHYVMEDALKKIRDYKDNSEAEDCPTLRTIARVALEQAR